MLWEVAGGSLGKLQARRQKKLAVFFSKLEPNLAEANGPIEYCRP
jgi:hypothetical protein